VGFRHELARLALESAVAPQRRRALHARLLHALAAPPAGPPDHSRIAHHAEQAGDIEAVLEHAPAAAGQASRSGAHREAAAQYDRALRHAGALPPAARIALLVAYGQEAQLVGRYRDSIDARLQAIGLLRELGDTLAEGDLEWRLTSPYIALGANAEAEAASRTAIELLEPLPASRELASAYASQAYMRMLNRDTREGVAWGQRAVALARQLDDPDTLAFGLNMVGTSYVMAGEIELGIDHLLQSLAVA